MNPLHTCYFFLKPRSCGALSAARQQAAAVADTSGAISVHWLLRTAFTILFKQFVQFI